MRQKTAALRDFSPLVVRFGSWLCENSGARVTSRHSMSTEPCPLYPKSGHRELGPTCPLCANRVLTHCIAIGSPGARLAPGISAVPGDLASHGSNAAPHGQLIADRAWNLSRLNPCVWRDVIKGDAQ